MTLEKTLPFYQSWIRSDFIHKVIAALGSRGLTVILSIITSIAIARALGPEGRGEYGLACAIAAVGTQLGILGFHSSNTFYVSRKPSILPVMISNSLLTSFAIGCIVICILYSLRHLFFGDSPLPTPLLMASLVILPFYIAFTLFQGLLTGIQKFKDYNLSEIINKALNTLFIIMIILGGSLTAFSATFIQGMALIFSLSFMLRSLLKQAKRLPLPSFSTIRKNFTYGGKAYLVCFIAWGITRLDIFILQRYQGFEQVGYLSVALSLIDLMLLFSGVIASILHPKLCAEKDIVKKWKMTKKIVINSSIIIISGAILAVVCEAPVRWIYGSQFLPSHKAFIMLLPGVVFLSIESILVQFITSISFPWSIVLIWLGSLILKVALSSQLVPLMGMMGIGISWNVTYFFVFVAIVINALSLKHKYSMQTLENTA